MVFLTLIMMKFRKLLLITCMVLFMIVPVFARDYKIGDVIQEELTYIEVPEDSSWIKFALAQGNYPRGIKIAIYAQSNVFCYVPGLEYKEPTPDNNPYKIAAEYTFTDKDIENLSQGEVIFTTTLKFDIMCGDIRMVITEADKKPANNLVEENREQGSDIAGAGDELIEYKDGASFKSETKLNGNVLTFIIPQGSYTLGDYIALIKDGEVYTHISITREMMETLTRANIEYSQIVDFNSYETMEFLITSVIYDEGEIVEVNPSTEIKDTPSNSSGFEMNPLLAGIIAFLAVLGGGLLMMYLQNKKKKSIKNEVAVYQSDKAHQIDDNKIIDADVEEKK